MGKEKNEGGGGGRRQWKKKLDARDARVRGGQEIVCRCSVRQTTVFVEKYMETYIIHGTLGNSGRRKQRNTAQGVCGCA